MPQLASSLVRSAQLPPPQSVWPIAHMLLHMPRVQTSVQYEVTALTCTKEKTGPQGWNVNEDAHLTAVVAGKGKVAATFGYNSINETDVKGVVEALKKAREAK